MLSPGSRLPGRRFFRRGFLCGRPLLRGRSGRCLLHALTLSRRSLLAGRPGCRLFSSFGVAGRFSRLRIRVPTGDHHRAGQQSAGHNRYRTSEPSTQYQFAINPLFIPIYVYSKLRESPSGTSRR